MALNVPFLEAVAAEYAGEPVVVSIVPGLDVARGVWGVAYSDDDVFHIDLCGGQLGVNMAETFWHELAHIVCGHVAHGHRSGEPWPEGPRTARWRSRAEDETLSDFDREVARGVLEIIAREEAEADAWGERERMAWERQRGRWFVLAAAE